jgi:hypothetical protein
MPRVLPSLGLPAHFIRQSSEYVLHHVPMHIREPEVSALEAVRELCMIDAQQVEHRGVEIVNVDRALRGVVAKLIGGAVRDPSLDAAARHPHSKAFDVMVAPAALRHGRAGKQSRPCVTGTQ